jgi:hypothetical protein
MTEINSSYIINHLGSTYIDGNWHMFRRDLNADITASGWKSKPMRVVGFLVRGSAALGEMKIGSSPAAVGNPPEIAEGYELLPNYPNPFNPATRITYHLPTRSRVEVRIYNILSQEIRILVNDVLEAGDQSVLWDARDNSGNQVASGVYMYQMRAASIANPTNTLILTKKMVLVK